MAVGGSNRFRSADSARRVRIPALRASRVGLGTLVASLSLAGLGGCSAGHALIARDDGTLSPGLAWFGPAVAAERATLARWAGAVGPPVVRPASAPSFASPADSLMIVTWNVALGAGDMRGLVAELRAAHPSQPIVLLLQEAFREGPEVPSTLTPGAAFASRLGSHRRQRQDHEIEAVARDLGLNVYYVPSMRNGPPGLSAEDRGNAILSSIDLTDLSALELPFERQRRVAVAATIAGRSSRGTSWRLRVVSVHLDNMAGPARLWLPGAMFGRARQARAIVASLAGEESLVLGGDFNTWFGFGDEAFLVTWRQFPDTHVTDRRPTFRRLLRLDHVFFRLPDGWRATFRRGNRSFGSDHWPLLATVTVG